MVTKFHEAATMLFGLQWSQKLGQENIVNVKDY